MAAPLILLITRDRRWQRVERVRLDSVLDFKNIAACKQTSIEVGVQVHRRPNSLHIDSLPGPRGMLIQRRYEKKLYNLDWYYFSI